MLIRVRLDKIYIWHRRDCTESNDTTVCSVVGKIPDFVNSTVDWKYIVISSVEIVPISVLALLLFSGHQYVYMHETEGSNPSS